MPDWLPRGAVAPAGLLVIAALVLGPRSCAGGLEWYAVAGVAAMIASGVVARYDGPLSRRGWRAFGGVLLTAAVFLLGIEVGNFQLFCRLF